MAGGIAPAWRVALRSAGATLLHLFLEACRIASIAAHAADEAGHPMTYDSLQWSIEAPPTRASFSANSRGERWHPAIPIEWTTW